MSNLTPLQIAALDQIQPEARRVIDQLTENVTLQLLNGASETDLIAGCIGALLGRGASRESLAGMVAVNVLDRAKQRIGGGT